MNTYESDFEDNLELARALVASNEDSADLWEANDLANQALCIRPRDADAWMLKAQIMSGLDDSVAGLAAIEMALRSRPDMAEAYYWRAVIFMDLARFGEALESIHAAFERMQPDDEWLIEDLFHEKASIHQALGQMDAAVETYQQGLQYCPSSEILKAGLEPLQRERRRAMFKVIPGGAA